MPQKIWNAIKIKLHINNSASSLMEPGSFPANTSFADLMLSFKEAKDDPVYRLREANRKLREATLRMKVANSRVQYSLLDLKFELIQIQERYEELESKLKK
ncbi:hypothetical protein ACPF7Z_08080 [Halomonas sp. GXIMD04776]|uniref:hypothetical protein n=1 Tax=Halomonas sp. GXIMD04776 TaxID=3415605 RepID=UPI003C9A3AF9